MSDGTSSNDGEGVWSPDIEQAFQEALQIYKPCGRRKHIIQDEGNASKMYGRNELIARHIKTLTGKTRTRKQVSSHIQVLARRKAKQHHEIGSASGTPSPCSEASSIDRPQPQLQQPPRMLQCQAGATLEGSALVAVSNQPQHWQTQHAPNLNHYHLWQDRPIATNKIRLVEFSAFIEHRNPSLLDLQEMQLDYQVASNRPLTNSNNQLPLPPVHLNQHQLINQQHQQHNTYKPSHLTLSTPVRHCYIRIDYTQASERFLAKQQLEQIDISQIQDKFPNISGPAGLFNRTPNDAFFLVKFWADISGHFELAADDQNSYFGFSTTFETLQHHKDITCSTKACSYGLQVVEKVDNMYGAFNSSNGRYSYTIESSPMCDFMSKFIKKLRQLPRISQMNSVLENFTVLQVISSESTSQVLLCLAYVFEVASMENILQQPQLLHSQQQQQQPQLLTRSPYHGPQYHVYKLTKE